jgi:hypothetical protein
MHEHKDLLKVAKEHDAKIFARQVKINKALKEAGEVDVTVGPSAEDLNLTGLEQTHDPFNGNLNNRRVAARIATEPDHVSGNTVHRVFMSNREKAAADVAKSLAVLPDPVVPTGDDLPPVVLTKQPTPGSPAATKALTKAQQKAADAAAKNAAPPTWGTGTDAS